MSGDRSLEQTKRILARLLAFPTLSGTSNLAMIDYVKSELEAVGAGIRLYPDDSGEKANLFATIGPDQPGGIILSGHSDVVPVAGQNWTVEPFALTERNGRLMGRGAVDMKGFIARLHELGADLRAEAPVGSRYVPPWTTVHVGRIEGGTARNVIARHCRVDWEIRPVRASDADRIRSAMDVFVGAELKPAMTAIHPDADVITHTMCEVASFEPVAASAARDLLYALTGATSADVVSFGTEAGFYQDVGISSVICGPGSIRQAHMADEFIEEDQLRACLTTFDRLLPHLV